MERSCQRLKVWQAGMALAREVYQVSRALPQSEQFGLISQMRRTAVSVPSNIAEGSGRRSDKDFRRFLVIARGSLQELETQLLLAQQLGLINDINQATQRCNHVFALLIALVKKLNTHASDV